MPELVVLPFLPGRNAAQAGHRLAFQTIARLAQRTEVHLLLLLKDGPADFDELGRLCRKEHLYVRRIGRVRALARWLVSARTGYPRFYTRYARSGIEALSSLCAAHAYGTIRFEFSQTFCYAPFARSLAPGARLVMSIHDVQLQIVLRRGGVEGWLSRWCYLTERQLLQVADEVEVLSEKDRVLVSSMLDVSRPVVVCPPSLSPFLAGVRRTAETVEKNSLLFWGAMGRRENEDAITRFVATTFSRLHARGMRFKLYIVGSGPGPKVWSLQSDHVFVTGFIEDPKEYFERCAIGVVPLTVGAGIKLKTLEMLAAGLTVVATTIGAEGVDSAEGKLRIADIVEFESILAALYVPE